MSLISYTAIQDGTTGTASQVNNPLNTIYNEFNGNISSVNLASSAVTTAKIDDGAVTSPKLAPVIIHKESTSSTGTTGSPADVAGVTATFTPGVASVAWVVFTGYASIDVTESGSLSFQLDVDSATTVYSKTVLDNNNSTPSNELVRVSAQFIVPLDASSHTLKMRIDTSASQDATVSSADMTILLLNDDNSDGTSTAA